MTPAIPVTVDTYCIQEPKNDDSYKEIKRGVERNLGKKWSQTLEKKTAAMIWPDVLFVMNSERLDLWSQGPPTSICDSIFVLMCFVSMADKAWVTIAGMVRKVKQHSSPRREGGA